MNDTEAEDQFGTIKLAEWAAAFAPHVREFPASRFNVIQDGQLVRFTFGNNGPPTDAKGTPGLPVFSVAVCMPPDLAAKLRDILNKIIINAAPAGEARDVQRD